MMAIFGWIVFVAGAVIATMMAITYVVFGGCDLSSTLGQYSTTSQKITAVLVIVSTVWMWYLVFHLAPFTITVGG